jgi:uncharacterized protein YdcH (DUF465 family)
MDIDQSQLLNLIDTNARFRMLYEEHNLLEKQLSELEKKGYLTPQEEVDKNKIKKMKLAGKDEMERIVKTASA